MVYQEEFNYVYPYSCSEVVKSFQKNDESLKKYYSSPNLSPPDYLPKSCKFVKSNNNNNYQFKCPVSIFGELDWNHSIDYDTTLPFKSFTKINLKKIFNLECSSTLTENGKECHYNFNLSVKNNSLPLFLLKANIDKALKEQQNMVKKNNTWLFNNLSR